MERARSKCGPARRRGIAAAAAVALLAGCPAHYALNEHAVASNAEGIRRFAAGDLEGAAAAFRLALEYNDRFSEPYNNLALVALRRGDLDDAEQLLRHALLLNQDFAEAWTNLGMVRLRRGDPAEAVDDFTEAIGIDPGQLDARYDLVLALAEDHRLDEAWEHALRLDVASPDDPAVQALVGWVAAHRGRCAEALGWVTRSLAASPDQPVANLTAGTCLLADERAAEAAPFLETAAGGNLGAAALVPLGAALLSLQRWDEARAAFAAALAEQPDAVLALAGAGMAALGQGDEVSAARLLDRALELDGAHPVLNDAARQAARNVRAALITLSPAARRAAVPEEQAADGPAAVDSPVPAE